MYQDLLHQAPSNSRGPIINNNDYLSPAGTTEVSHDTPNQPSIKTASRSISPCHYLPRDTHHTPICARDMTRDEAGFEDSRRGVGSEGCRY